MVMSGRATLAGSEYIIYDYTGQDRSKAQRPARPKRGIYLVDHPDQNIANLFMPPKRRPIDEEGTETFAQRLARLRKQRGLSQVEIAGQLGIAQPNISAYERGEARPSLDILIELTRILKVTSDELLGLQASPAQPLVKDRRLLQHLALIERLPKRDKDALLRTIRLYVGRVK